MENSPDDMEPTCQVALHCAFALSNKALQTDKAKLSRLLQSQESRQLAFAAELGCYVAIRPIGPDSDVDEPFAST